MNSYETILQLRDYDLAATLASGQAFRWRRNGAVWTGIVDGRWVALEAEGDFVKARTAEPIADWGWLTHYLQADLDLPSILATFPDDEPMRGAVSACRGLRLLRQDPWECLASFILSSTKQIVQIQQIITLLCLRHGEPLPVLTGHEAVHSFPSPIRLADLSERELRDCKMGFRAPYLRETARAIAAGEFDLARLHGFPIAAAREELCRLPGVGNKIADCVLLFAYGFPTAFPVDVWVMKALRQLYFPRRQPARARLQRFTETYFGQNAGYAQQYLFHYMRTAAPARGNRESNYARQS